MGGDSETIKTLLNICAQDVHAKVKHGATPLHFAAVQGHVTAVQVLLDSAAQIDAQDSAGMTPMHRAAVNGKIEVIRTLLSRGANSSIESNEGIRAVNYASNHNHLAVALILSLASSTP